MKLEISIPKPIERILQLLHEAGGKPRLVGGAVRDAIVGIKSSDIDIITIFKPNIVSELLTNNDIFVKDTGVKYGTVTAFLDNCHTQITTLRVDKECDGRHTNPEFTDDFEADAQRRDFTINAMSYCPFEQKLYDYTGGYNDLIAKRVLFIGDPKQRIEEDYLRILRFFRFSDKFANNIDQLSLKACIDLRAGLTNLSKERILMEMTKIMESPTCHKILKIMVDNEILKEIIPIELTIGLLEDINNNAQLQFAIDACTRFAALMIKNDPKKLDNALQNMVFSTKNADKIVSLVAFRGNNPNLYLMPSEKVKNIFLNLWVDNIYDDSYMLISECWKREDFAEIHQILQQEPPKFPVNGNDITEMGIKGAAIGKAIRSLKTAWIESKFELGREELLSLILKNGMI